MVSSLVVKVLRLKALVSKGENVEMAQNGSPDRVFSAAD